MRDQVIPRLAWLLLLVNGLVANAWAEESVLERSAIFPANPKHNHASCVVETKPRASAGGLVFRQRRAQVR